MNFGYLSNFPPESFDRNFKAGQRDPNDIASEYIDSKSPVGNWSWTPISECPLKRGDIYIIEAKSPTQQVFLKFTPKEPTSGYYEIKYGISKPVETGSTLKVTPVRENEGDFRFEKIKECKAKFVVITIPAKHPKFMKAWVVGLNEFKQVPEEA